MSIFSVLFFSLVLFYLFIFSLLIFVLWFVPLFSVSSCISFCFSKVSYAPFPFFPRWSPPFSSYSFVTSPPPVKNWAEDKMKVIYFNSGPAPMCDPAGHGNEQGVRGLRGCAMAEQLWRGQRSAEQTTAGCRDRGGACGGCQDKPIPMQDRGGKTGGRDGGKGREYWKGSKQREKVRKQGEGLGTSEENKIELKMEPNKQRENTNKERKGCSDICISANAAEKSQTVLKK